MQRYCKKSCNCIAFVTAKNLLPKTSAAMLPMTIIQLGADTMIFRERTVTKVKTRCFASLSAVSLPEQAKLKTLHARSLRECFFTHIVRGVLARKRYLWGNAAAEAGIFGSNFFNKPARWAGLRCKVSTGMLFHTHCPAEHLRESWP